MPRNAFGKPNSCACQLLRDRAAADDRVDVAPEGGVRVRGEREGLDREHERRQQAEQPGDDHLDRGARPPRLASGARAGRGRDRPRARRSCVETSLDGVVARSSLDGLVASPHGVSSRPARDPGPARTARRTRHPRARLCLAELCARAQDLRTTVELGSPPVTRLAARLRLPRPPRHPARRRDRPARRRLDGRRGRGARRGDGAVRRRSTRRTRCSCWRRPRSRTCRRNLPERARGRRRPAAARLRLDARARRRDLRQARRRRRGDARGGGRCAGASGVLHTGHWLMDDRATSPAMLGATSSTTVHFADLSDDEIDAYVATGEPLAVAGAFTVDGLGGPFVDADRGRPPRRRRAEPAPAARAARRGRRDDPEPLEQVPDLGPREDPRAPRHDVHVSQPARFTGSG